MRDFPEHDDWAALNAALEPLVKAPDYAQTAVSTGASRAVTHPSHYVDGRKYEPVDVIADWDLNFDLGNAVKYISRAGRKDPEKTIEDLQKAIFYIEHAIKEKRNEKA